MHVSYYLLPPLLFLLTFTTLSHGAANQQYANCAPFEYACGTANINISYPFELSSTSRPNYCGYPGYILTCSSDNKTLSITINNHQYQVLDIDYTNQLLRLVDSDLANDPCTYSNSSISNSNLFQFSDRDQNVTIYFDCSSQTIPQDPSIVDTGCALGFRSYYQVNNGSMDSIMTTGCSKSVQIPMSSSAATDLESGKAGGLTPALQEGFYLGWTVGSGWCSECKYSGGYCGSNGASLADHTCFCPNGTSIDSCNSGDQGSGNSQSKNVIIGVSVGLASFLIVSFVFVLQYCSPKKTCRLLFKGKKAGHAQTIESFLEKHGQLSTKRYTYSQVKKITRSFSEKLGQGGFGSVYKGSLFDGHSVAVKVLCETKGDGEDFINEVAAIGNTSHVNVVTLRGFCVDGSKRALIYDFMPNGSLEKYIYSEKPAGKKMLGWEKLYEIVVGVARGLEYLHRGCNTRIVHFDIKPHNILLDQDFCPKISDFGMAKLCPPKQSILSMYGTRGTIGYIAPELFSRTFGAVSSKSDVYSYGMMVLEMFGGKRSMNTKVESVSETYFPQSIYQHLDNFDGLMEYGVTYETGEIAKKMLIVGFWCVQTKPEDRPSMNRVVEMLEGSMEDLPIPPKPLLSSPLGFIIDDYITRSSS